MSTRLMTAAACALLLCPVQAAAQIYAWRDANGTLVLSDKAITSPTDVYVVEGAPEIRTTRPVTKQDDMALYESLIAQK